MSDYLSPEELKKNKEYNDWRAGERRKLAYQKLAGKAVFYTFCCIFPLALHHYNSMAALPVSLVFCLIMYPICIRRISHLLAMFIILPFDFLFFMPNFFIFLGVILACCAVSIVFNNNVE